MSMLGDLARQDEYGPEGDLTPLDTLKRYASVPRRAIEGAMGSVLALPQRAFQASEQMRTEGPYDPAPAVEAALLPMGTGAVAGVKALPGEAVLGAGPIRAYHGSPHDFDKFDLAKIGTGEGAQAYGHGLYFAENEGVARGYRNRLAPGKPENVAPDELATAAMKPEWDKVVSELRPLRDARDKLYHTGEWQTHPDYRTMDARVGELNSRLDDLTSQAVADTIARNPHLINGRMYEVNLNADPAHFIEWEKRLGQQSPHVQETMQRLGYGEPGPNMAEKYRSIGAAAQELKNPREVQQLAEAGIPGIKYLDQGSRFATPVLKTTPHGDVIASHYPPPTSNYVVFNPDIIDIMRKYGLAGAAPAGLGALAAQDSYQQE